MSIKIKADKENHVLHVTDTGIGMTKDDLIKNLGTIAKSGTSEFFQKIQVSFITHSNLILQKIIAGSKEIEMLKSTYSFQSIFFIYF